VVIQRSSALVKAASVPRLGKPEELAVEMMAKLVAKGAEERAKRGDLFPDGGPHPETDEHVFGMVVPEQLDRRTAFADSKRAGTLACVPSGPLLNAADLPSAKNVLILYSFSERESLDSLQPLEATIRSHVSTPVDFNVEYLESQRFGAGNYEQSLAETLRDAYGRQKLDLVIVAAYPALRFAAEFRDRMFPGVPIVFTSVAPGRIQGRPLWPGVTGITIPVDVRGTLDLALRLHPDTRNVAVVTGGSEFERYWREAIIQEVRRHADRLNMIDLVGLPIDQLLQNVSKLPPHTVVLFQLIPQHSSHAVIG